MASEATRRLTARLSAAQEGLERQLAATSPERFHRAPRQGEWSPAEIVAHVAESTVFAAHDVLRMVQENDPEVGRTEQDREVRQRAIAEHSRDSKEVAVQRLRDADAEVLRVASGLSDSDLGRTGRHRQRGAVTVQGMLESVASHIEEHIQQVKEAGGQ